MTSQLDTIPSCYRRSRHTEFQPLSGRHPKLDWPAEAEKELGTVIRLIDHFAEKGGQSALDFAIMFYRSGNDINSTMHHMTRQMLIPFARDYINYVKTRTEEWVTAAEAVQLLKPVFNSQYTAQMTICKRAHSGLILSEFPKQVVVLKSMRSVTQLTWISHTIFARLINTGRFFLFFGSGAQRRGAGRRDRGWNSLQGRRCSGGFGMMPRW